MKDKIIVIIGPTAVGKTSLSIDLAKRYSGEIISGDSMQIYQDLDIGTAKVTEAEMQNIPHHLIDIKKADESFSVAEFQSLVKEKIREITERGKLPIIVGGTGLYINSVLYDYNFTDVSKDENYRKELENHAKEYGNEALYNKLKTIDEKAAQQIHPNNVRRVIRALEIYHRTGQLPSVQEEESQDKNKNLQYETALIGLTMDRQLLYNRINKRVDLMIEEGLLEEVSELYRSGIKNCQSVQAIGYKELYAYLAGEVSFEEAIDQLKQNSRRYAKRQLTWFRNKMPVTWFDVLQYKTEDELLNDVSNFVNFKLQIKK